MSGYEADSDPAMEIDMIDNKYENFLKQIVEPPEPEIINIVSEEIENRKFFEFTKSDWMNIFSSLLELISFPTVTTSTVPPLIFLE